MAVDNTRNLHTVFPGNVNIAFFSDANVDFVSEKLDVVLKREYAQKILVSRADIVRVMQRIYAERQETIPRMNERVIMAIANDFRTHQIDVEKKLAWSEAFPMADRMVNVAEKKQRFDLAAIPLANRRGEPKVGGTLRFAFI